MTSSFHSSSVGAVVTDQANMDTGDFSHRGDMRQQMGVGRPVRPLVCNAGILYAPDAWILGSKHLPESSFSTQSGHGPESLSSQWEFCNSSRTHKHILKLFLLKSELPLNEIMTNSNASSIHPQYICFEIVKYPLSTLYTGQFVMPDPPPEGSWDN